MKKNVKRFVTLVACMAMTCGIVAGCGNTINTDTPADTVADVDEDTDVATGQQTDEESIKAVMVSVMSGGDYWGPIEEGFLETCEKYGWEGEYWSPVTTNSGTEMVELIETAITQGYDVISTCITDPDIFRDVLTRAREEGIILIAETAPSYDLCDAFVGQDQVAMFYDIGTWMAEYAMEQEETELNVLTIQTTMATDQNANRDSFMQALKDTFEGPVNDLGQETCDSNAATAQDKISAAYVAYPELNVVGSIESYAAIGAAAFIRDNGLQGKIYSMGLSETEEIIEAVKDGILCANSTGDYYPLGQAVVEVAKQILDGEENPSYPVSGAKIYTAEDYQ